MKAKSKRPRPELRLRLHPSERQWHRQFTRQAIREYGSVSACLRVKLGIPGPGFSDAVGEVLRWTANPGTLSNLPYPYTYTASQETTDG